MQISHWPFELRYQFRKSCVHIFSAFFQPIKHHFHCVFFLFSTTDNTHTHQTIWNSDVKSIMLSDVYILQCSNLKSFVREKVKLYDTVNCRDTYDDVVAFWEHEKSIETHKFQCTSETDTTRMKKKTKMHNPQQKKLWTWFEWRMYIV